MGIIKCHHHGMAGIVAISQGVFDAIENREEKVIAEIVYCYYLGDEADSDDILEIPLFFTDEELRTLSLDGYEADEEGRFKIFIRDEEDEDDIEMFPHLAGCWACFTEWKSIFKDHNENFFVWGSVDNISQTAGSYAGLKARFAFIDERKSTLVSLDLTEEKRFDEMMEVERLANEQAQEETRRRQTALRRFFADKSLFTVEAFDREGNLADREYRRNDFAAEGLELIHRMEAAWPNRLEAPSLDIDLFEKALIEIRAER
jgi:hypothetical protein